MHIVRFRPYGVPELMKGTVSQATQNQKKKIKKKNGMEKLDVKIDRHRSFHIKELGGKWMLVISIMVSRLSIRERR
jgi:hypothetical protein